MCQLEGAESEQLARPHRIASALGRLEKVPLTTKVLISSLLLIFQRSVPLVNPLLHGSDVLSVIVMFSEFDVEASLSLGYSFCLPFHSENQQPQKSSKKISICPTRCYKGEGEAYPFLKRSKFITVQVLLIQRSSLSDLREQSVGLKSLEQMGFGALP